jgi:hypothetical protein
MKRGVVITALLVLALGSTAPALAGGHVNFILGQKMLDDENVESVELEDQPELAVSASVAGTDWPVHIAADLVMSREEATVLGIDVEGATTELDLGVRKIWERKRLRPFVGGGVGFMSAEVDLAGFDDDDGTTGFWIDGGLFWRLGRRFNIGFEARVSQAEVSLFGTDTDIGGNHAGLLLGFGWPPSGS